MNKITSVTRRKIVDHIKLSKIDWWGRLDEVEFLSRLYDLDSLPTTDPRPKFSTARLDILQHRFNNDDWPENWVFSDDRFELQSVDEKLLNFLCEMLHPVVRDDLTLVNTLKDKINEFLKADGYEIFESEQISGHPVFAAREIGTFSAVAQIAPSVLPIVNSSYIRTQISRMETSITLDPSLAIGTAKELIETVCKSILDSRKITYNKNDDVPDLMRLTIKELRPHFVPDTTTDKSKGEDAIKVLLNNLSTAVTKIAEIRNLYGTGHGKGVSIVGLDSKHARLVVNSAGTLAMFMFETHQESVAPTTI